MSRNPTKARRGARFLPASATALILLTSALLPVSAIAVTFTVAPHPNSSPPMSDANHIKVQEIMEAAAEYWSDIIRDPHVFNIQYLYQPIASGKAAFSCYPMSPTECYDGVELPALPNTAYIAIDAALQWYYDPTPTIHSEFALERQLARALGPEKSAYFTGTVPDLLEVSYSGPALSTAPLEARTGIDLFSTVLHEMGHIMGTLNEYALGESEDGAYDFNPLFVDGAVIGAKVKGTDTEHLAADGALMRPGVKTGIRYLPSAIDVFAIAAAPGWSDVHLPRRELWDGAFFHLDGNWSGNSIPEASTDVWIRWGGATGLNTDAGVRNLVVSDDSSLWTMGQTLEVGGAATVEQGVGAGSSTLGVDDDLIAGIVRAGDGGVVALTDGHIQALLVEIDSDGMLVSDGTVGAITAWGLDNDGTLTTTNGSLLVVNTLPDLIDLDGAADGGAVAADGGDLLLQDALSDPFDGEMTVGAGSSVFFAEPWTLGSGGTLTLAGGAGGDQARIEGAGMTLRGTVEVTGQARIFVPLSVESTAVIDVAEDSELELQSATELAGGTYTGAGTIQLNGDTTVVWPTVMAPAVVDLDGGGSSEVTVANNSLTLQVDRIDLADNVFDGTLNVQGWLGSLRVFLDDPLDVWEVDGVLDLSGYYLLPSTQLDGNGAVVDGELLVDGLSRSNADLELRGTLATADAQARLFLNGGGVNVFRSTAEIAGSGWVEVLDGTELRLENGFDEPLRLENAGTVTAGVEPGNPIAMPRVLRYTQTSTGVLELEIGGLIAGVDHDRLRVMADAELSGTLRVELANGFTPQLGDSFYVLTTSLGSVIGTWDSVELPALDPSLRWHLVYGTDTVLLEVLLAPVIPR